MTDKPTQEEEVVWFRHAEENVQTTTKLPKNVTNSLNSALAFANRDHPGTMNELVKHILSSYTQRRAVDFPVPAPDEKFSFTIPEKLRLKLDALVEERRVEEPGAEFDHLLLHAFEHWLSGQSRLARAWRADQQDSGLEIAISQDSKKKSDRDVTSEDESRTAPLKNIAKNSPDPAEQARPRANPELVAQARARAQNQARPESDVVSRVGETS